MERHLLILDEKGSSWFSFLEEFFEDTPCRLSKTHEARHAALCLDQRPPPMIFANADLLSLPLTQKIRVSRVSHPEFRIFQVGTSQGQPPKDLFDAIFEPSVSFANFQKQFVEHLPMPETLRILVIDNEPEIRTMIREFLERRVHPSFQVEEAANGEIGLQKINAGKPDVLILDIKMPVKGGQEVYREIIERNLKIPVIIFFDAISGEEVSEIRRFGKPAIVEKGSRQSHLAELVGLIKKKAYFG